MLGLTLAIIGGSFLMITNLYSPTNIYLAFLKHKYPVLKGRYVVTDEENISTQQEFDRWLLEHVNYLIEFSIKPTDIKQLVYQDREGNNHKFHPLNKYLIVLQLENNISIKDTLKNMTDIEKNTLLEQVEQIHPFTKVMKVDGNFSLNATPEYFDTIEKRDLYMKSDSPFCQYKWEFIPSSLFESLTKEENTYSKSIY